MGSKAGALKIAAKRIGVSFATYLLLCDFGMKFCFDCKRWKDVALFGSDKSRGDGRSARCNLCREEATTHHPIRLFREKNGQGLNWCVGCKAWLSTELVNNRSRCNTHQNEYDRERYSVDDRYRMERRQHSHSRQRGVAAIPVDGQEILMEVFEGMCAYCDNPATSWDHIIPITKGGQTEPHNIVPACRTCNSSKGNREVVRWAERTGRIIKPQVIDVLIREHSGFYV